MAPDTRSSKNVFARVEGELDVLTKDLTQFLKTNDKSVERFRQLSKVLYDSLKREDKCEELQNKEDLDQLIIEDFDDEQIWQELELRNQPLLDISLKAVSRLAAKTELDFGVEFDDERGDDEEPVEDNEDEEMDVDDEDFDEESDDEESEEDVRDETEIPKKKSATNSSEHQKKLRKTIVDDRFFKLGALEEFLDGEDMREERRLRKERKGGEESDESEDDDSESLDHFGDFPSDDEGRDAKYDDFFDPIDNLRAIEKLEQDEDCGPRDLKLSKGRKSVRFADDRVTENGGGDNEASEEMDEEEGDYDLRDAEEGDVEEDDTEAGLKTTRDLFRDSDDDDEKANENDKLSTFEKNQKKLREKISKLEDARLAEKEWQMRGEVSARSRPENSLLEEHLDFDHQTRQAPQITRTLTQRLEDWIVQRIKDKAWDDVVRKVKPTEEVFEFRRRLTLDQEKSKLGLAEVYEQEFLKMKEGEKETVNPDHEEIKKSMGSLFKKLDALSNFHFMPRPAQAELKLVNNLPTIAVEEVAPATVSDGTLLAPEEIKEKPKREVLAKDERSKTDKNRERRLKKVHQRKKREFEELKEKKRAERDPKFRDRLERKTARENLRNSTNTKVLKTPKERDSALKSSTKFFERLEDQVVNQMDAKKKAQKMREQKRANVGSLKL